MATASLTPNPKFQAFDSNGDPLSSGRLYTYLTGTSTPKSTYPTKADAEAGTNANANPVVLDSRGEANVWLASDALYRFTLTTSADAAVWGPIDGVGDLTLATLATTSGASLIGFTQSGGGSVARSVQDILRQWVSPEDFGAVGDGSTDDTAAFQAAAATGKPVRVHSGRYLITENVNVGDDFYWLFEPGAVVVNGLPLFLMADPADYLFKAWGSAVVATTTTSAYTRGRSKVIAVADASTISVGDMLAFVDSLGTYQQFNAIVRSKSGNNLTMDRSPSCDLATGGDVLKVTPVSGRFIGATFDGNGTIAAPRYGFGFHAKYCRGVHVANITADWFGAKVVEISRGCDCSVDNVTFRNATDPTGGGLGGVGYAVRLSVANDCRVSNIFGYTIRHVVDCTSASRNIIGPCGGAANITSYVCHFDHCVGNRFINCDAEGDTTSAYAITPASPYDDEDNVVFGGIIRNCPLITSTADNGSSYLGNRFIGTHIISDAAVSRVITGSVQLEDCSIDCRNTEAFNDTNGAIVVTMTGGQIISATAGVIASLTNANSFIRCSGTKIILRENYRTFNSTAKSVFKFDNCSFIHLLTTTGNNATLVYGLFDSSFVKCSSEGTSSYVGYSTTTGNAMVVRDCKMVAQATIAARNTGGNEIALTIDHESLQVSATGVATVTYSAAYLLGLTNAADDTAAAAAGVAVGQRYRNGSIVMVRVA